MAAGVELRGCKRSCTIVPEITPDMDSDWGTEFLDLKMIVRVVDDMDEAMRYIEQYGSQHTEVIVTGSYDNSQRFLREVDASAVMINASSRFNDGGQFGLGAEIGISTTKLHAYGPMGLGFLAGKPEVLEDLDPLESGGEMIETVSFSGTTFNSQQSGHFQYHIFC